MHPCPKWAIITFLAATICYLIAAAFSPTKFYLLQGLFVVGGILIYLISLSLAVASIAMFLGTKNSRKGVTMNILIVISPLLLLLMNSRTFSQNSRPKVDVNMSVSTEKSLNNPKQPDQNKIEKESHLNPNLEGQLNTPEELEFDHQLREFEEKTGFLEIEDKKRHSEILRSPEPTSPPESQPIQ